MAKILEIIPKGALDALKNEIGLLSKEQTIFYFSEKWSMHHLFLYLLEQSGPSSVRLSSFSISDEAVRGFVLAKDQALLLNLKVLFDYTTKTHKSDLMYFIHNVASKVKTYPNHSKTVFIESDTFKIAILSSQNLNKNNRLECGVITTERKQFDKLSKKFNTYFDLANELWT